MFRAILWKEWRELWPLLVGVTLTFVLCRLSLLHEFRDPLFIPSHYITIPTIFFMFLLIIASLFPVLYVPAHLLTKEREMRTIEFLRARPVDRMTLWRLKTGVGLIMVALVAVVLSMTAVLGARFLPIYVRYSEPVWTITGVLTMVLGFSFACSALFTRMLTSMVTSAFLVYATWFLSMIALLRIEWLRRWVGVTPSEEWLMYLCLFFVFLSLCLFLVSMAVFAGRDCWRRARSREALTVLNDLENSMGANL
ncbi:MAG: hypothetical protein Kow0099_19440 [Candidatus Abyssubacteria bacterium]